jgi:hypothetical protein
MWERKRVAMDDREGWSREWEASGRIPSCHSLGKREQHDTGAASRITRVATLAGLFACRPEINEPGLQPP